MGGRAGRCINDTAFAEMMQVDRIELFHNSPLPLLWKGIKGEVNKQKANYERGLTQILQLAAKSALRADESPFGGFTGVNPD
jgi:hypothetical protein